MKPLADHFPGQAQLGLAVVCAPDSWLARQLGKARPILPLLLLLMGFLFLEVRLPLSSILKIGADEHYELSKATLLHHGHKLYTEIWDDQPPLVTVLIAKLTRSSHSALAPRLMTVAFAAVLLAAVYSLLRSVSGPIAATCGTLLLLGSPGFLELSNSVMQEMLGLAPVVVAFSLLWHGPRTRGFCSEILAGAVFGFGLQLKLIGLAYLPLALVIVFLRNRREGVPGPPFWKGVTDRANLADLAKGVAIFGLVTMVGFVVLNYATGYSLMLQLRQAWAAHFASAQSLEYGSPEDFRFQWSLLVKNWDATVPALIGVIVLVVRSKQDIRVVLPLAWLGLGFLVFARHRPWWPYYYIHTALPICWCAGVGIDWLWRRFVMLRPFGVHGEKSSHGRAGQSAHSWMLKLCFAGVVVFSMCSLAWIGGRLYLEEQGLRNAARVETALVLKEIDRFKPFTKLMFSDPAIYSFYSDVPMPPRLAMLSLKRFWTGDLDNARIVSELRGSLPGLILLGSQSQQVPFQDLLDREYKLVYQDGETRLFAHASISKRPL